MLSWENKFICRAETPCGLLCVLEAGGHHHAVLELGWLSFLLSVCDTGVPQEGVLVWHGLVGFCLFPVGLGFFI